MNDVGSIREELRDALAEPGKVCDEEGLWALLEAVGWPDPTPELEGLDAHLAAAVRWLGARPNFTARMAIWDAYRALTQQFARARKAWAKAGLPLRMPQGAYIHQLEGYAVRRGRDVYRAALASPEAANALAAEPGFLAHAEALIGFEDVFFTSIDGAGDDELVAYATAATGSNAGDDDSESSRLAAAWDALRDQPALEEPRFWEAVAAVRWDKREDDAFATRLIAALGAHASPATIAAFAHRRHALLRALELRLLAWEADTGRTLECGDDSFRDLMNHVIGLGHAEYEATLTDPARAAARADSRDFRESFAYVEQRAWRVVMAPAVGTALPE